MSIDNGHVQGVTRRSAVLDTNVLLDLYVYHDPRTAPLKSAIDSEELALVTCAQAIHELADVLAREKFGLSSDQQQAILDDWSTKARLLHASEMAQSPWRCKDKADQIFLDMAWSLRPCLLLSKDLQVLRFAKRAHKEGVQISAALI